MSSSPKKLEKSKSKDNIKDKDKQKSVKDKSTKDKGKDKDTKSKKSKDQIKMVTSQIKNTEGQTPPPPFASIPAQPIHHICSFHNQPNYTYCQTCEQLACHQCAVYGPHQSQIHKIVSVEECYRNRYLYLKQLIYNDLLKKRDELKSKLQVINQMCQELKYNKQIIERQINKQFNAVLQRLKVAYGGKLAVLYNAMAQIQRQLQTLNNLGQQFFSLTNLSHNQSAETNPKGLVPFLLKSRHLQDEAQNLIAFPINEQVRVNPFDLPRQIQQKKALLQKAKNSDPTKQFKHQVIFSLLKEGQTTTANLQNQFFKEANSQKTQWIKIISQLRQQLAKFDKICHFCGVGLNKDSVNTQCFKNIDQISSYGYCINQPPVQCFGNRFHYFDIHS